MQWSHSQQFCSQLFAADKLLACSTSNAKIEAASVSGSKGYIIGNKLKRELEHWKRKTNEKRLKADSTAFKQDDVTAKDKIYG